MSRGKCSLITLITLVLLAVSAMPMVVHADGPVLATNNENCVSCHEDVYFLHDIGNWYCLRESPMSCVDCHGGNPLARTQEQAHFGRAVHPVLNDDTSKCQECHPEESSERVQIFNQAAGISQVLIAAPYTPAFSIEEEVPVSVGSSQRGKQPGSLLIFWEIIPLVLLPGLALTIYLIHRRISNKSTQRSNTK